MADEHATNGNGNGSSRKNAKHHPPAIVGQVMARLVAGEKAEDLATEFGIPKQTVSDWAKKIPAEVGRGRTKKAVIEDLFAHYLEKILIAQIAQVERFTDVEWIRKQPTEDLLRVHAFLFDKGITVFDAARRGEQRAIAAVAESDCGSD